MLRLAPAVSEIYLMLSLALQMSPSSDTNSLFQLGSNFLTPVTVNEISIINSSSIYNEAIRNNVYVPVVSTS